MFIYVFFVWSLMPRCNAFSRQERGFFSPANFLPGWVWILEETVRHCRTERFFSQGKTSIFWNMFFKLILSIDFSRINKEHYKTNTKYYSNKKLYLQYWVMRRVFLVKIEKNLLFFMGGGGKIALKKDHWIFQKYYLNHLNYVYHPLIN